MRALLLSFAAICTLTAQTPIRPPATPLVTHDPYFSLWSMSDQLTTESTKHWTGTDQPLSGLIRIDGQPYRFLGAQPRDAKPMEQTLRLVTPTRTRYEFSAAGVKLALVFFTPAFAADLDLLSRPITYLTWEAAATDARPHAIDVYLDASAVLAANSADQRIVWSRVQAGPVRALRAGTAHQEMLVRSGDNLRIEWGHVYLALPPASDGSLAAATPRAKNDFLRTGKLPAADELEPQARIVLAAAWSVPNLTAAPIARTTLLAYDDQFSIQYLQRNLRPWWRRNGMGIAELLQTAAADFESLHTRAIKLDADLIAEFVHAGGPDYAAIAILAYRQTLAAHKLVADLDGTPLYFSKENFSNGCIATVDVTYPSAPFFLRYNPALLKAMLQPILDYASLPRWRWPFAPHDLGQYPLANGQVYGGGERTEDNQMPVEESGNMLILTGALAQQEKDVTFARRYWPMLGKWAAYLRDKGMDPDNQLSTDDFAGHLAHNTNLSIKAIVALGAYAQLAEKLGETNTAKEYRKIAQDMAKKWPEMAKDGDHYRLAFDKPGTWSQKYNLVWDKLLSLNLFDPAIARAELAFYKTKQNSYGLPLDNRETYTKLDWIIWTATMTESPQDFQALIAPVMKFLNESPSRVPMSDWYRTTDAKMMGFQARSVVGGVFIPLLRK